MANRNADGTYTDVADVADGAVEDTANAGTGEAGAARTAGSDETDGGTLRIGGTLHGFDVNAREELREIDGTAWTMRHTASGAKLLFLDCDDENKAFAITFKTPPGNSTGVFHILEHSVLCGSDRFPVKEPFVNLLKTSMQTFLNAMTFGDKTMYPVASTNEQDLLNLMDVYLDAVFHPAIYRKEAIFRQEGWHYELADAGAGADRCAGEDAEWTEDAPEHADAGEAPAEGAYGTGETAEGETAEATDTACNGTGGDGRGDDLGSDGRRLVYNGVVFNEMKGALSDAQDVLYDELQAALFPDTAYRFESGGTPEEIPNLTYEAFLNEHRAHYRTDNSAIVLYGDLDINRVLAFLDERYLAPLAAEAGGAAAPTGAAAPKPRSLELQDPVVADGIVRTMETAPENACCGLGYVVCTAAQRERLYAADILLDVLMGSNEAPLKRALLDAKLADDVSSTLADHLLQPFAAFTLKGSRPDALPLFKETFERELARILDAGIDPALIEASLAHEEFVLRERDFGVSDGVALAMSAMCGWLYEDELGTVADDASSTAGNANAGSLATAYLRFEDIFATLRGKLGTSYFDDLARELFLSSAHRASVEVRPVEAANPSDEERRLAAVRAALDGTDLARIEREVEALREAQERPDTPEELATLPQLTVADLGPATQRPGYRLLTDTPVTCLRHDMPTRGLAYARRFYDARCLSFDELPYLTILSITLGKLDTARHTASQLDTLIQARLGNLGFFTEIVCPDIGTDEAWKASRRIAADEAAVLPLFVVTASSLGENATDLCAIAEEVMFETDFSNTEKIRDILTQKRFSLEQGFAGAGHNAATNRVSSYSRPQGIVTQALSGVDFYRFLKDLLARFDERAADLSMKLKELCLTVFADSGLTLSFSGPEEAFERYLAAKTPYEPANLGAPAAASAGAAVLPGTLPADRIRLSVPAPVIRNEAFIVPSDVVYVAQGYDRGLLPAFAAAPYDAAWSVACRALSFDFLWNEVRVKGGAYGVGFRALRSGMTGFYSYRDPHIDETIARYAAAADWLARFDPSPEEMDGYLVSTVAGIDAPVKARAYTQAQALNYFCGRDPGTRLKSRAEVLAATPETLRSFAAPVAEALAHDAVCVFGSKDIVAKSSRSFDTIDLLNE